MTSASVGRRVVQSTIAWREGESTASLAQVADAENDHRSRYHYSGAGRAASTHHISVIEITPTSTNTPTHAVPVTTPPTPPWRTPSGTHTGRTGLGETVETEIVQATPSQMGDHTTGRLVGEADEVRDSPEDRGYARSRSPSRASPRRRPPPQGFSVWPADGEQEPPRDHSSRTVPIIIPLRMALSSQSAR